MTWAVGLLLQSLHSGLVVETGAPDAFCPDLRQTQEAVDARLGTLEVAGGPGWRARYTIGHAPEPSRRDFVRLELFDPKGERKLERELPMEASCSDMAKVIALVLDRYFRELGDGGDDEGDSAPPHSDAPHSDTPSTATTSSTTTSSTTTSSTATSSTVTANAAAASTSSGAPNTDSPPAPAAHVATRYSRLRLVGVEVAALREPSSGLALRFQERLSPFVSFGVAAVWPFSTRDESLRAGASAQLRSVELRGNLGLGTQLGRVRLSAGPSLIAAFERASTSGLSEERTQSRVLFGGGIEAGAILFLTEDWALTLSGAAHATFPGSARFMVDGDEVLKPAGWFAYLGAGAGYAF